MNNKVLRKIIIIFLCISVLVILILSINIISNFESFQKDITNLVFGIFFVLLSITVQFLIKQKEKLPPSKINKTGGNLNPRKFYICKKRILRRKKAHKRGLTPSPNRVNNNTPT